MCAKRAEAKQRVNYTDKMNDAEKQKVIEKYILLFLGAEDEFRSKETEYTKILDFIFIASHIFPDLEEALGEHGRKDIINILEKNFLLKENGLNKI